MRALRLLFALASVAFAGTQAFGAKEVAFTNAVDYSSGINGANTVVAADVNFDGSPDLIVGTNDGVSVLLNNGDGTFAPSSTYSTRGTFSARVAVVDVNNDSIPDIVATNQCLDLTNCSGVAVLFGNGDGTFQSAQGYNPGGLETGGLAVADVNGDGSPDLVLVSNCQLQTCAGGTSTLLLNNRDGTFGAPIELSDSSGPAAIGDLNGDGIADLVTGGGIMLGVGDGTFNPPISGVASGAIFIALGDVNGDGLLDVVATHPTGISIQLGNGDGTLQSPRNITGGGANPLSVTIADFNGDGKPDLAVANECNSLSAGTCVPPGRVGVLAGNGDGTFQTPVLIASHGAFATSVAAADWAQDGKIDLAVANACVSAADCTNGVVGILTNTFRATVMVSLEFSSNPVTVGDSVSFRATLFSAPPVPDGETVTFTDGTTSTTLGTATAAGGIAEITTAFSKKGGHSIRATYAGDLYHMPAMKALLETVSGFPSTTMVTSSPNPSTSGTPVQLTATVSSAEVGGPTGTVTFQNGTLNLGSAMLSGGVATITTTKLPVGVDTVTATYRGDSQTVTSTGTTTQTVN